MAVVSGWRRVLRGQDARGVVKTARQLTLAFVVVELTVVLASKVVTELKLAVDTGRAQAA